MVDRDRSSREVSSINLRKKYKRLRDPFKYEWNRTYRSIAESKDLTPEQIEASSAGVWDSLWTTVINAFKVELIEPKPPEIVSRVDSKWEIEHEFSADTSQCCSRMIFRPAYFRKAEEGEGTTQSANYAIRIDKGWGYGYHSFVTSSCHPIEETLHFTWIARRFKNELATSRRDAKASDIVGGTDVVRHISEAETPQGRIAVDCESDSRTRSRTDASIGYPDDNDTSQVHSKQPNKAHQRSISPIDSGYHSSSTSRGPEVRYRERLQSYITTPTGLPARFKFTAEELPRPWYDTLRKLYKSVWRPKWQMTTERGGMTGAQTKVASITGEAVCWVQLAKKIAQYDDELAAIESTMLLNDGRWNVQHQWDGRGTNCTSTISFQPRLQRRPGGTHGASPLQWSDQKIEKVHEWNPNDAYEDQSPEAQLQRIRKSEERARRNQSSIATRAEYLDVCKVIGQDRPTS